jgi:hypothetical protein
MDSFENLLFGLCRFKELAGVYPEKLTIVGWNFKRYRFEIHRRALHFPLHGFRYEGVGDPPDLARNQHFETLRIAMFERDPFGQSDEAPEKSANGTLLAANMDTTRAVRRSRTFSTAKYQLARDLRRPGAIESQL